MTARCTDILAGLPINESKADKTTVCNTYGSEIKCTGNSLCMWINTSCACTWVGCSCGDPTQDSKHSDAINADSLIFIIVPIFILSLMACCACCAYRYRRKVATIARKTLPSSWIKMLTPEDDAVVE
eukprot:CAMPEP_0113715220 /NCGR_PEP_ID=MMETSP0038_2-20120614/33136_1 /TAXON_ID=2898 /ORGANISM="Cryptomonas paramecium" /LENGTH=126 /DNA_ID=CAMNT_0000642453 /DNA_START=114 /DNA_END=491 /DNA_ORIENTATION=+ /assembly_acc=CAM_ASM_000170